MTGRPGQTRPLAKEKGGEYLKRETIWSPEEEKNGWEKWGKYLEKENNQTAEEKKNEDHIA